MTDIEQILTELYVASRKLDEFLSQFEKQINRVSKTPFKEMGLSDKVRIAELFAKVKNQK